MDRKINAAAFKAQCLALIDEVAETGLPITSTAWTVRHASSTDSSMTLLLDTHTALWIAEGS